MNDELLEAINLQHPEEERKMGKMRVYQILDIVFLTQLPKSKKDAIKAIENSWYWMTPDKRKEIFIRCSIEDSQRDWKKVTKKDRDIIVDSILRETFGGVDEPYSLKRD